MINDFQLLCSMRGKCILMQETIEYLFHGTSEYYERHTLQKALTKYIETSSKDIEGIKNSTHPNIDKRMKEYSKLETLYYSYLKLCKKINTDKSKKTS